MLRKQLLTFAPAILAVSVFGTGCDKAKKLAEEHFGIKQLDSEEQAKLLEATKWNSTVDEKLWKIHGGVEISDNFKGDLSKEVSIPLPFNLDENANNAASGKKRMLLLLKEEKFTVAGSSDAITRFRIASIAEHDGETNELKIDGGKVNQYLDENQRLQPGNQAGKYLLAEGVGSGGLAFIEGKANVQKNDGSPVAPEGNVMVFTSSSPFVTLTGASGENKGQYMLAMLDGSKGQVTGYGSQVPVNYKGTPASVSTEIAYAGSLDQYKEEVDGKVASFSGDSDVQKKANSTFDDLNKKVTDFLGGWKVIKADLLFVQPPASPPPPPVQDDNAKPVPPTKDDEEVPPAATDEIPVVVREDPKDPDALQVDLGCSGFYGEGTASLLTKGDDIGNDELKGWRGTGDVRITVQEHEALFDAVDSVGTDVDNAKRYLDTVPGYCLLTTGDGQYQKSDKKATQLQPGPFGGGKVSQMWQKISVPSQESTVKSIQMRVAFFSQEFPQYVGSQFNDSFYIKFDELPEFLAEGNLNDLAGAQDLSSCRGKTSISEKLECGEWKSFKGSGKLASNGVLWDIDRSTQATKSKSFGCTGEKCYHGYIEPRIICRDLNTDHWGKDLTLRMVVTDAGDSIYDSALAVDSIVFSTESCATGTFTREIPSAVTPAPAAQ